MAIDRIFGYGSLIWKPPPHVIDRLACFVKGYTRRFAQLSHDHRGTPENPGLVVTLVSDSEWLNLPGADDYTPGPVWGVMYTIDPAHAEEVHRYLDEREKDGYDLMQVEVFRIEDDRERSMGKSSIYIGHVSNPSFYRPARLEELATRIHQSVGPSGSNKEYLYHLNREVQGLCPQSYDPYLHRLNGLVQSLDQNSST